MLAAATKGGGSLHARLKAQTAPLHARTEELVPLLRPELDRAAYGRYLGRLFGFVGPVEARLEHHRAAWSSDGLDFAERRKAARIATDLAALGWAPDAITNLPVCETLPALRSLGEAWGALYVLEGSTLGGVTILRVLGPRLGLTPESGLSFLVGHGERTGVQWKAFLAALDRFAARTGDEDGVVAGACATFEALIRWLEEEPRGA